MKEVTLDIVKAIELLETKMYDISRFERIYAFSNENLTECFENFNIQGKKCLTVLGSSDQAFDLYLMGAEKVDAFDINPLAKYYFYLKKAAIASGLTKEEYLKFFNGYGVNRRENALDSNVFYRIRPFLEKDSKTFWSYLFENYSHEELSTHLFSRELLDSKMLEKTIHYLSDEGYQELQKKIYDVKINFYPQDLLNLPEALKDTYDLMYLSNIIQYIDGMYSSYPAENKKNQVLKLLKFKVVLENLRKKLKSQGQIIAGYIYAIDQNIEKIAVFNPEVREKIFSEEYFKYYYFSSIEDICDSIDFGKDYHNKRDACIVYPPSNKKIS